jgi:prepilin-type N-terminal cleavage/methylation domain-containing protein/prepilin-type processing-associated H-X9-DG protein
LQYIIFRYILSVNIILRKHKYSVMKLHGFTLFELLVVIAILALLLTILVPAMNNIREQGRISVCSSNLRQTTIGLTQYEAENNIFPYAFVSPMIRSTLPPGGYVGNASYDHMGWWWFQCLDKTLGRNYEEGSILWCPSRNVWDNSVRQNPLCANYGVNLSICKYASGSQKYFEFIGKLDVGQITFPEETILVLDSGYSTINWWQATDCPPEILGPMREDLSYVPGLAFNRSRQIPQGLADDAVDGRHANQNVNIGFVDGHVQLLSAESLYVPKHNQEYQNKSPLWVP